MNKKGLLLIVFVILILVVIGFILVILTDRLIIKKPAIISGVSTGNNSSSIESELEADQTYTQYTNEEFGFSLAYPASWDLPQERRITPPQQYLYTLSLNPGGEVYTINIYDQPSPISLASFVRGYFNEVSWTQETEINNQEALEFVLPEGGLTATGIGAIVFRQGSYILVIQTPIEEAPANDLKQLINDPRLTQLSESFQWVD